MNKQEQDCELVVDIIEHPENYTSEQLAKIMSDPNTRELYRLICLTDSTIEANKMNINVDAEWMEFTRKHLITPHRRFLLFGSRAASIATIVFTSIVAVAAGVAVTISVMNHPAEPPVETNSDNIITMAYNGSSDTSTTRVDSVKAIPTSVMFENAPLKAIMEVIVTIYGVDVRFNNREAAALHLYYKLESTLPLDEIVGQLNTFEQINIKHNDNTLTID